METARRQAVPVTAFGIWLRTGRRIEGPPLEVKFNPWHDPENGRFTFVGQGNYFPGGAGQNAQAFRGLPGFGRGPWARELQTDAGRAAVENDPRNPKNHSTYTVRAGDTLASIAARRKGLRPADLAWVNGLATNARLRPGQPIKLPHQQFLDAGRDAKNKFLALDYYMRRNNGRLPPDPANPPSLHRQIYDSDWRRESRNGYDFQIDIISRTRLTYGQLSLATAPRRSRYNQAQAGKPDRLPTDDGGHYIAARFNGPRDSFNHFAQDSNFNRGAYRAMEDGWAKELLAGRKVFVTIKPQYVGTSKRPYRISIIWTIDGGKRHQRNFPNAAKGK